MTLLEVLFPAGSDAPRALACVARENGNWSPRWFTNSADMRATAKALRDTHDVYFSYADYAPLPNDPSQHRRRENAVCARAFVLDIDVARDGVATTHKYATAKEAAVAFGTARRALGLPRASVFSSGGGLHVYWPLAKPIPLTSHEAVQSVLTASFVQKGLKIDAGPSNNVVGWLRVPGTYNWKTGTARPVTRLTRTDDIPSVAATSIVKCLPPDALRAALAGATTAPRPRGETLPFPASFVPLRLDTDWSAVAPPPKELDAILAGCAQMRHAPGAAEPVWRAGLAVARLTKGGDASAQQWSEMAGSTRYDRQATTHKLHLLAAQQGAQGMPTTCVTFDKLNPGTCTSCRHFKTLRSPILLGLSEAPPEPETPPVVATATAPVLVQSEQLPGLLTRSYRASVVTGTPFSDHDGFFISGDNHPCKLGKTGEDGEVETIVIYPGSVRLMGYAAGEVDGRHANMTVWHISDQRGLHEVNVPTKLLGGTETRDLLGLFAEQGIIPKDDKHGKLFSAFLRAYFRQTTEKTLPATPRSDAYGWRGESFSTAHTNYTAEGTTQRVFHHGDAKTRLTAMGSLGDLEAWRDLPRIYKAQGQAESQFVLMQSFASPLIPFTGENGILVHLHSAASGTGKSTLQRAVNSVWGSPHALMLSRNDTVAATGLICSAHQNLPICVDEITNAEGPWVADFAFSITQGTQKQRSTQDAKLRTAGQWRLLAVTSGNESVRDQLLKNRRGDKAAEDARFIEVPIQAPKVDSAVSGRLAVAMTNGRGAAGELYTQWLVTNRMLLPQWVSDARERWSTRVKAKSDERFWVACMAATEVAFHLSKSAGLHDFDWEVMEKYMFDVLLPAQRAQVLSSAEDVASVDVVAQVINAVVPGTVAVKVEAGKVQLLSAALPNRETVARRELRIDGSTRLYITAQAFKQWAHDHGVALSTVKKQIAAYAGFVHPESDKLTERKRLWSGLGQYQSIAAVWCYQFHLPKEEEDAEG